MSHADRPGLDKLSVLDEHGSRRYVYPADARGKWSRLKPWVYGVLIAIYVALPLVHIGGHPAVWIDLPRRHFYLFGATFNAQDFYLAFFVFTGIGFSLIVAAALFGRVWCGWACPQTVFLDGVFRRIERLIEGPANERAKLARGPWTTEKIVKKSALHFIYFLMATLIAHIFLAYFASVDQLGRMITEGPGAHPGTFIWAVALTAIFYGNFWWFREQLCIVICPYGRLQSALQDKDTINVIYDRVRGEPRGKAKEKSEKGLGDCVDCNRCVAVCPTGIDIRNGNQLECIGCSYCIDACDDIMHKLGRKKGLIRYDSQRMVEENKRRFWRPRVFFYAFMGALGLTVATYVISQNDGFEAEVLRASGTPFSIVEGGVENTLRIHVVNKHGEAGTFRVEATPESARFVTLPDPEVRLEPFADHDLPVRILIPSAEWRRGIVVRLIVTDSLLPEPELIDIDVLGPHRIVSPPPKPSGGAP
ncbi:MAG: cytochrome c oxidase accessory protein CcoG [Deltaproteobacteria bacterium]|nr:cytochrome c oxidase accessory protein CcoG [Deltaproteobacteria bacterium]